jgi:hypothetical protein
MGSQGALVATAWQVAAAELGIEAEVDGALTDVKGREHRYVVHVADFGGPRGTICSVRHSAETDSATLRRLAHASGYHYAELADAYTTYDRSLFVATLDDWQWFGAGEPPAWYTGTPWTS